MEADTRRLLSDSSGSAVSIQDPRNIKPAGGSSATQEEYETEPPLDSLPGVAAVGRSERDEDRVSLRSRSSSISTTTDDQAALLRRDQYTLESGHLPTEPRIVKSATTRRIGVQHFGGELERLYLPYRSQGEVDKKIYQHGILMAVNSLKLSGYYVFLHV